MLSRPAVARSATGHPRAFGKTSVSGPGQNASASRVASAGKRASARAAAMSTTCEMSGLKRGAAFGFVEPGDGLAIGRVGAEAVNGLGRKGDEPAGRKLAHRVRDRGVVGTHQTRLHVACRRWPCHRGTLVLK